MGVKLPTAYISWEFVKNQKLNFLRLGECSDVQSIQTAVPEAVPLPCGWWTARATLRAVLSGTARGDMQALTLSLYCLQNECEGDLAEAMPALEAALAALDTLNPADISLVKSMQNPPGPVKLVMESICVMKGLRPERKPDPGGSGNPHQHPHPTQRPQGLLVPDREGAPAPTRPAGSTVLEESKKGTGMYLCTCRSHLCFFSILSPLPHLGRCSICG